MATRDWRRFHGSQNGIPLAAENDPSVIFAKLFKVDNRRAARTGFGNKGASSTTCEVRRNRWRSRSAQAIA